jgi:hypothetical protein
MLRATSVQTHGAGARYWYVTAEDAVNTMDTTSSVVRSSFSWTILCAIALDAAWLLRQSGLIQDQTELRQKYTDLLAQRGLASYSGRIDVQGLRARFCEFYLNDIFALLSCGPPLYGSENWLNRLLRKSAAQHPIYHLLLIHFLGHSAESFWALPVTRQYIVDGPWPCLNPVCDAFLYPRIKDCTVILRQGKPVRVYVCNDCGFVYSKRGLEGAPGDDLRALRVESFGPHWMEKLQQLWRDSTISLREISRQLKVDPVTVKFHARKLGLPSRSRASAESVWPYIADKNSDSSDKAVVQRESYRSVWLAAIDKHSLAGCNAARREQPAVYAWLYRNDRSWLVANKPVHKVPDPIQPNLDWHERDTILTEEVRASYVRLMVGGKRPVYASRTAIGKGTRSATLIEKHLDRLPQTAAALYELAESREAYAVRRIQWVTQTFLDHSAAPPRWRLVRASGVERIANHPIVARALTEAMTVLTNVSENVGAAELTVRERPDELDVTS